MSDLRQGYSSVVIKGELMENTLEQNISKRDGFPYIAGDLSIKTSDDNIVKVNMYAGKFKKAGGESKLFKSFKSIMETYKSSADAGEGQKGDNVEFTSAELSPNSFMTDDGSILENYNVRGVFPNRIKGEFEPTGTFEVEVLIDSIFDEMDEETQMETGAKIIKGYFIGYAGSVVELEFAVESPQGVSYVESQYKKGDTVKLFGQMKNKEVTITKTEEMAFGEDIVQERTVSKKRLLVTRGTTPYSDGKEYAIEEVKEALKMRNINLKSKSKTSKPAKPKAKETSGSGGSFDPSNF